MRRPVKKKRNPNIFALYDTDIVKESHAVGYNQSCDDWEKWMKEEVLSRVNSMIDDKPEEME